MKKVLLLPIAFCIWSCASLKDQQSEGSLPISKKEISHSVFLVGGLKDTSMTLLTDNLRNNVGATSADGVLLLLGDHTPVEISSSENRLKNLQDSFAGKVYSIAGEEEWLIFQRNNTSVKKGKAVEVSNAIKPSGGCPISSVSVSSRLEIIFVDSEWYLSDWDKAQYINKYCDGFDSRRQFMETLESLIKENISKNIIIAMHHPVFSNGKHSGKHYANDFFALGGGVLGLDNEDTSSPAYRQLAAEITTLCKLSSRIAIVSGHESSLQLLEGGGIYQIVSGSVTLGTATRLSPGQVTALGGRLDYHGIFTSSKPGYARLDYYRDGSSSVNFYANDNTILYQHALFSALPEISTVKPKPETRHFPSQTQQAILSPEATRKSAFYRFFWGNHYREYYSEKVTVQTAILDTLYGGLTILKEGGGHQSQSLRLKSSSGRQFAMRSLKKNPMKYLRFKIRGAAYNPDIYENTAAEGIVEDFFTTAHPYSQLAVNKLAEAASINHSDTKLYYFPKQNGFGELNEGYGDQLYFVEERSAKHSESFKGFGYAIKHKDLPIKEFAPTTEVLKKVIENNYTVDQQQYIRSRIFDLLIGDWDRHQDQWRWALRETGNEAGVYAPIPRDRDAAFSKFDGSAFAIIKLALPITRCFQSYSGEVDPKTFYGMAYNLDKMFLNSYTSNDWHDQAVSIQRDLTPQIIDEAFKNLPIEMQDESMENIKAALKKRLENLDVLALEYANYLIKSVVVYGSQQDDRIEVVRLAGGDTKVAIYNKNSQDSTPFYSHTFRAAQTKEILVYGLNGNDNIVVSGNYKSGITLRLIGGYGEDSYLISNAFKTKVYDFDYERSNFPNSKPTTKQFSSLYETNNLYYRFFWQDTNILLPSIGFATDDGLFAGIKDTYTVMGFNGRPQRQVHNFSVGYFFKYQSVQAKYDGKFINVFPKTDLYVNAYFTDSHFSKNFFGYGNQTHNNDDALGKDFNRARTRQFNFRSGFDFRPVNVGLVFESYRVEQVDDRLFNTKLLGDDVFKTQNYVGGELGFKYRNRDAEDFPTSGIYTEIKASWKANIDDGGGSFGFFFGKIGFDQKLTRRGNLVLQSTFSAQYLAGKKYYFYNAASIGGNNGLRGFRNERFTGKASFNDNNNIKLKVGSWQNGLVPVDYGIYGGFDCGRVWADDENSEKWHTSQGGGFWMGGLSMISLQTGYFNSIEGNIVSVGFNFNY